MHGPKLVIMAAGLGSRYGGLKQIAPVDDAGHIIMDFSIYDALRAGFEGVVCVVKPETQKDFCETIGARVASRVQIVYAHQTLEMLPEPYRVPEGRVKPWGTAHAVLCAAQYLDGPFAVINADDFYGRTAFSAICDFLTAPGAQDEHAMVAYRLGNTLTEHGYVSRGVCTVRGGHLAGIVERTRIQACADGAAFSEDGGESWTPLSADAPVSMNLWGFRASILPQLRARFVDFLQKRLSVDPLTCEYYLPSVPNALIQEGLGSVRVLGTREKWFGITYPGDLEAVRRAVAEKKRAGEYPEHLWTKQ